MATQAQELIDKINAVVAKQRELNDLSIKEGREFNDTEQTQYDNMTAEYNTLKRQTDRMAALASEATAVEAFSAQPVRAGVRPQLDKDGEPLPKRATAEYKKNFRALMQAGEGSVPREITAVLEKAVPAQGGVLVPQDFDTNLNLVLLNANIIRQLADVQTVAIDTNLAFETSLPTAGWIDELGTYPKSDMTFARAIYGSYKVGVIVQVSEELLADSFTSLDSLIADEAGRAIALTEEAAFFSGDGNKKPTGITTGTGQNQVTSASGAAVSFDDILNMIGATPRYFQTNGSFVFPFSSIMSLRKAKTNTGEYIWQPSQAIGAPDRLYNYSLYTSDQLPALALGSISGLFGDFKQYRILDRAGFSLQRMNELYAETGAIGFRVAKRVDAHLIRPSAITILTQKGS